MLHLAAKAFWPGRVPFPVMHVDTGHNFPEVIDFRDETVERLGVRLVVARCRTTSTTAAWPSAPTAPATRCRPSRCSTPSRRASSTPSSAAPGATRRRPAPRSASSAARRVRPVGPAQPAPRAVEPLQRPAPPGRARARVPDLQLDRARRLALHRAREDRAAGALLRPRARGLRPRRHVAAPSDEFSQPARTRRSSSASGALPHRRRHELHRRRRVRRRHRGRRRRRGRPHPPSPSVAPPAPTTVSPRPPWKTARGRGTSDEHARHRSSRSGSLNAGDFFHLPPQAPSTTASRPWWAGCCTTPRRCWSTR